MRIRILRLVVTMGVLTLTLNLTPWIDAPANNSAAAIQASKGRNPIEKPLPPTLPPTSAVRRSSFVAPPADLTVNIFNAAKTNGQDPSFMTEGILPSSGLPKNGAENLVSGAVINRMTNNLATIVVTPSVVSVAAGTSYTFTASGFDQDFTSVAITPTWTASAGTIDSNGTFSAPALPTSGNLITATSEPISGTALVDVVAGPLNSIVITPTAATVSAGGVLTFTASGYDLFGNPVTITPTWSTDGGTITQNGVFTAQSTVASSRWVTVSQDSVSTAAQITVTAGPLAFILVSPNPADVVVGGTLVFTATGYDAFSNIVPITPTWATNCGSISSDGTLTAQHLAASGQLVTATSGSIVGTASVNIHAGPLNQIIVSPSTVTLTVASTQSFSASGVDQYNNSVVITPTWTTDCGSMSTDGLLTAQTSVAAGRHVTATQGIISSSALVYLRPGPPYTLAVQPPTVIISAGQRITFTAIATDTFANFIGDVTGSTSFSVASAAGGAFVANVVTPTVKNTWVVTGVNGLALGHANLTVNPAAYKRLAIESTPGGTGTDVNAVTMNVYNNLPVYTAAYDVYSNYIGPVSAAWGGTGVVAGHLSSTSGTSTTFSPIVSGTGTITAASGGITDTTGIITVQAPLLSISKSASPNPLTPGQWLHYTIVYTNIGNAAAQNVVITETYPPSVTFNYAVPTPTFYPAVWSVGSLAVNEPHSVIITMTTPSQMPVGSVLTNAVRIGADEAATAAYTTTTLVNALPNLSASVIDQPNPVRPGDLLNYTIQYRNDGTAPVSNVRITDTYPSEVSFVSASPAPDQSNNVWLTSQLNGGGDNRTIVVTVRVNRPLPDTTLLTNRVVVSAQEAPPYTTTQQTLVTAPRLQLDSTALPATPPANSLLTYSLLYSNTGSSYADTPVITAFVPANTSFVQCQPNVVGGIDCNVNGSLVTWNLNQNINPQTSGAVTLTVSVDNNLANGTVLTATSGIYSSADKVGDAAILTTTVASAPNVSLSQSDGRATIAAGDFTTYTLSYANTGTAPAQNVVITDRLPANTSFVGCTSCTPLSGGVYSFTLGTVNANDSGSRTFSVRVANTLPAGLRAITNTATISTKTGGDGTGDNFAQDVDTVSTYPRLALGPSYDFSTPYPGKVIAYTLYYTNTSAMDTTGVQITTTRPAWLSTAPPGWTVSNTVDIKTIGNLPAGQSGSVTYVMTLPQSYTQSMNAFTQTFFIQDGGPGGLPPAQDQKVTSIGVPDLIIERVGVPTKVTPGTPFTATVTIRNLGMGRACNPKNCGGFWVDVFVSPATPPPSYPYTTDGDRFAAVPAINAGQAVTVVVQNIQLGTAQKPLLYFKVDNFSCAPVNNNYPCLPTNSLGGLVPEYNEYNNVFGPVYLIDFKLYMPLIRRF